MEAVQSSGRENEAFQCAIALAGSELLEWKLHLFELEEETKIDPSIKYVFYQLGTGCRVLMYTTYTTLMVLGREILDGFSLPVSDLLCCLGPLLDLSPINRGIAYEV